MKNSTLLIIIALLFSIKIASQNTINHTYPFTDGPNKNPMKGWNSGWWNDYESATVGFQYLKWKDFEPTDGNFDFDAVENVIQRPGSQGRHIILRLYTDWFGNEETSDAGPSWVYNDYGVERLQAPNGKYITNYNHPNYITQAIEAIEALANHYDNDPRMYSIQLGVLGYWGEWHDYSFDDPNFEIEENTMNQILAAYNNLFATSRVMGRYPWREPLASVNTIGFHNDFFGPFDHSNDFDDAVFLGNKWLEGPIGGEIPPNVSQSEYDTMYATSTGMNMINKGHYSTMQAGDNSRPCIDDPNGSNCAGFMAMHRKMGYNFQIEAALFAESVTQSDDLAIEVAISNVGVAPMYYDWDVQFALLDQNNQPIEIFETPFDLTSILPEDVSYTISVTASINSIPEDDYQLAIRLIQPEADSDKTDSWQLNARNTYILFSNEIPIIEGAWNTNNALVGGWSILGTITIDNTTLSTTDEVIRDEVNIYPNPANDKLHIEIDKRNRINSIQIYDTTGRLIQSIDTPNKSYQNILDVKNISNGIYHISIHSDYGNVQKRFIKQ